MNTNLNTIVSIEFMCAIQGIEFRAPLKTSPLLLRVMEKFRSVVPSLENDRFLANEIDQAATMVADGSLINSANLTIYNEFISQISA